MVLRFYFKWSIFKQNNNIVLFACAEDNSWSQPEVKGSPPCSRHGHVSVAIGTDIYVHGGMAGTDMFDDLYRFNTGMPTRLVAKALTLLHLLPKIKYLKKA